MKIFIETERFLLREILTTDVQGMYELDSDPEVHKYLGNKPVKTIQEVEQTIQYIRTQYQENGIGRWAIVEKSTDEFVGWSGLKLEKQLRKGFQYYDLGYRLKRKYWGRGIATETAVASLKYGFRALQLDEICAAADIENIGSNKVLTKVGLQFVETFEFDGAMHNWYKMEKKDWELKK